MDFKDMENIYNEVYKSPIVVDDLMDIGSEMISEINKNVEDSIFKSIHKIGINVDKEELIRALNYDRDSYSKGYKNGYNNGIDDFLEQFSSIYNQDDSIDWFALRQLARKVKKGDNEC